MNNPKNLHKPPIKLIKTMTQIVIISYAVSILFIGLGIPLALNKIKPNIFYGYRSQKTLENQDIWYAVNSVGGKSLIVAGVVSIVLVFVLNNYWQVSYMIKIMTIIFTPVMMAIVSVLYTLRTTT